MKQEETIELTLSDFPQDVTPQQDKENYYNPVNEYTMEGVYVKTYKSPAAAARTYGIEGTNIRKCGRGEITTISGKIFLRANETIEDRLNKINSRKHKSKTELKHD